MPLSHLNNKIDLFAVAANGIALAYAVMILYAMPLDSFVWVYYTFSY